MQTLLLLPCYAGLLSCHRVTQRLQLQADTVRYGTELRATKQMKRGGNPSHSAYCIYLYTEFAILMQYHCKVYTDFGLLILFLNALRHFILPFSSNKPLFFIMVFYGSKMHNVKTLSVAFIFWAHLLTCISSHLFRHYLTSS